MLEVSQYTTSNYSTRNSLKIAWYWHKNRDEDQWNRTKELAMNPHSNSYLIFDKSAKNVWWRKTASSTNVTGKIGYPCVNI
jgi:hypothetical protein